MGEEAGPRPDLGRPRRVHLIGAGGAGMSAIGTVLMAMGHRLSGSDAAASASLDRLGALGAEVHVGHDPLWLDAADLVARSTAVPTDDPEVVEAVKRGLRVWRRSEVLAAICAQRRTVAVSGTHGKTTTSSMLAVILRYAGWHPSMVVGADIAGIGTGAAWDPDGEWMVVEADESDGTFLALGAEAVVVTSVEPDHLDFYGTEETMRRAFVDFVDSAAGPVVLCADDPGAAALARRRGRTRPGQVLTYGTAAAADVRIHDPVSNRSGALFALSQRGEPFGRVSLQVPGTHNILNATAAMTMASAVGIPWETGIEAVAGYLGVARRFEMRGERDGVTFVDDYGHLPAEVRATVAAARAGGWDRIVAVFQPHRYSRTEALWQQFADSFVDADVVVVTEIYPAGEQSRPGISGELVARAVRAAHPAADVRFVADRGQLVEDLRSLLRAGDLCLTMGAGDLTTLPDVLLQPAEGIRNG